MSPAPQRPITYADTDDDDARRFGKPAAGWRRTLYTVIFEADTAAGKRFDLLLIAAIVASVAVVIADSVVSIAAEWGPLLHTLEWAFTLFFTTEYLLRLACIRKPLRYAGSFFGVIDLIAFLPTYLALLIPGIHALMDVRILRLLRIFRILKLASYIAEYRALGHAIGASRRKILIFLSVVLMLTLLLGTAMYVVEGPEHGYTSIPVAMYWAVVTMTTVGYGDVTPHTDLGRLIASAMMLLGWGILAVPTGIVSAEMTAQRFSTVPTPTSTTPRPEGDRNSAPCPRCGQVTPAATARYCMHCGNAFGDAASASE